MYTQVIMSFCFKVSTVATKVNNFFSHDKFTLSDFFFCNLITLAFATLPLYLFYADHRLSIHGIVRSGMRIKRVINPTLHPRNDFD